MAQARHIHALTMSRPGIHCVETQSLVVFLSYLTLNKCTAKSIQGCVYLPHKN